MNKHTAFALNRTFIILFTIFFLIFIFNEIGGGDLEAEIWGGLMISFFIIGITVFNISLFASKILDKLNEISKKIEELSNNR